MKLRQAPKVRYLDGTPNHVAIVRGALAGWLDVNCPDHGFWLSPVNGVAYTNPWLFAAHLTESRLVPAEFKLPYSLRKMRIDPQVWRRVSRTTVVSGSRLAA